MTYNGRNNTHGYIGVSGMIWISLCIPVQGDVQHAPRSGKKQLIVIYL